MTLSDTDDLLTAPDLPAYAPSSPAPIRRSRRTGGTPAPTPGRRRVRVNRGDETTRGALQETGAENGAAAVEQSPLGAGATEQPMRPGRNLQPFLDADAHLGPAMQALSPLMQRFVVALVQTGCTQAKAAELAGYTGSAETLRATGHRVAHDARVQAALHEEATRLIGSTSTMAVNVLIDVARDKTLAPRDRIKAASELLNRGGLHPLSESKLTVEHVGRTEKEQIERIRVLAGHLGLDPRQLLGAGGVAPEIIDAQFEVHHV